MPAKRSTTTTRTASGARRVDPATDRGHKLDAAYTAWDRRVQQAWTAYRQDSQAAWRVAQGEVAEATADYTDAINAIRRNGEQPTR